MITGEAFVAALKSNGVSFITGVPDSLMKGLLTQLDLRPHLSHHIAVNEGAALALASGYHLATGSLPLVYLQNSGLGNLVNPLTSLNDSEVYSIPVLLLIGWRGQPGIKDEPQHVKMGRVTPAMLDALEIPYRVMDGNNLGNWEELLQDSIQEAMSSSAPVAILVTEGCFTSEERETSDLYELSSEEAIRTLFTLLNEDDVILCTTGKIGRVFYKLNQEEKKFDRYFLNVGSMGHVLSIAGGISMAHKGRIIVLDGDGSVLMHTGALSMGAEQQQVHHVVLNNGAHQSVGGQPTKGFDIDLCGIARAFGYPQPVSVTSAEALKELKEVPRFLEIRINHYTAEPLPRPAEHPSQQKKAFMRSIHEKK